MNTPHETYMQRCLQLAGMGAGYVAPNPMVGAVLVYNDRIIGEGYHRQYGGTHAEVNCINAVSEADQHLIAASTIYVSLEPCAHFGKTPPCADLIIKHGIKKAVIGCRDPFEEVNGKGIEKLQQAGVAVTLGILEDACIALNKRFFCFHLRQRPYIILKWAASQDHFIAAQSGDPDDEDAGDRTFISNAYSNRLVHKWRSEEAAILVGTNTALLDDPSLTTRYWTGKNPLRLVIDKKLVLPETLYLFDQSVPSIVFNEEKNEERNNLSFIKIDEQQNDLQQIMRVLYKHNINSVMVEGGARLLQSFIDLGLWDEARVITNHAMQLREGLKAPVLTNGIKTGEMKCEDDSIITWKRQDQQA